MKVSENSYFAKENTDQIGLSLCLTMHGQEHSKSKSRYTGVSERIFYQIRKQEYLVGRTSSFYFGQEHEKPSSRYTQSSEERTIGQIRNPDQAGVPFFTLQMHIKPGLIGTYRKKSSCRY